MRFFLLVLFLCCTAVQAGQIELRNGDQLVGELVRLDGEHVIWKSANFGEQRIPKKKVKNITSAKPLKINGNKTPCMLENMEHENLVYYCGLRSDMRRVSLLSLKVMTPFDDFVADKFIHTGSLGVWGIYVRGNEVRDEWNLQGELAARRGEWRHTFKGEYAEASWSYSNPSLKWNARYGVDWFFRERWFWYNNVATGVEQQRGLDDYISVGTGVGHQFWEKQETALAIKVGLSYFSEEYAVPVDADPTFEPKDTFTAGYFATDFRYTLPWGVGFFHNHEFTQSFDEGNDWHLKTATGLSAMLISKIYSEIKLDYSRDNEPQPDKEARDMRLSVGVSYKW